MSPERIVSHFFEVRSRLGQWLTGGLLGLVGILFTEIGRPWSHPVTYTSLILPILGSYVIGGTALSGGITSALLLIYSIKFVTDTGWFAYLNFLLAALLVALVVALMKKRISRLSSIQVREEERRRLKLAASAGKLGIWEWDVKEDKVIWDDQMFKVFGVDQKDFTGTRKDWERTLYPADAEKTVKVLEDALSSPTQVQLSFEFRVKQPKGEIRFCQSEGLITRDSLGTAHKLFGITRDITEEIETAQKLQELNAYLETALEQSQAGIVIAETKTGAIRFANRAALQIAGKSKNEIEKDAQIAKFFAGEVFVNEQVSILSPQGGKRILLINSAPIRRPDRSVFAVIAVFVDHTDHHKLLEELKTAKERAEEAMQAKARFLDVAAHELRTPVTAASLILQLAQRQAEKGSPVEISVIDRMKIQMDRLSRLVVDLLEVSKLDRGLLELELSWIDLVALIKETISNFQIQFPSRSISFTCSEAVVLEKVDSVRLHEVVSNLIDNAIKYSSENSPIEIQLRAKEDKIIFSIKDQGKGLSEKDQKRLFAAFERCNSGHQKKYAGLGLGLFISREIITMHGGSIGVKSTLGEGSTFFFELPRYEPAKK